MLKLALILWVTHSLAFGLGYVIHALLHERTDSVKEARHTQDG